jgi:hypothetical protein
LGHDHQLRRDLKLEPAAPFRPGAFSFDSACRPVRLGGFSTGENAVKNPLGWLIVVVVLGLGIAGIVFLGGAVENHTPDPARTPSLVGGIVCLFLSVGLLVFGVVMFRKRE